MGAFLSRSKTFIKWALHFARLTDEQGRLSLTNLALIGCVARVILEKNPNGYEMGALLGALANYSGKKFANTAGGLPPSGLGVIPQG